MTLSKKAWSLISNIFQEIAEHPFNQQLMQGILPKAIFSYYIEQDAKYLHEFAKFMEVIADKITPQYRKTFLKFAEDARHVEKEIVHEHFRQKFQIQETGHSSPALVEYLQFLFNACHNTLVERAVAAVLPCFWIYREVALKMKSHIKPDNPFLHWIESYTGDYFGKSVVQAIAIFDELADSATETGRDQMLGAFCEAARLELRFWDDAYSQVMLINSTYS